MDLAFFLLFFVNVDFHAGIAGVALQFNARTIRVLVRALGAGGLLALHDDVVLYPLNALNIAGDFFGTRLLGGVINEPGQLHLTAERVDMHLHPFHVGISEHFALHLGGDAGVVDGFSGAAAVFIASAAGGE